jgi:hypothetical protein
VIATLIKDALSEAFLITPGRFTPIRMRSFSALGIPTMDVVITCVLLKTYSSDSFVFLLELCCSSLRRLDLSCSTKRSVQH